MFHIEKKAAQSTAAYCCPDHKREPWQLFLSLHHNLKLMRFPPTNSPYLTGKTSSFHGNRMEGENKRETETEGRMDVRGVERGELTETGKWETRLLLFFSSLYRAGRQRDLSWRWGGVISTQIVSQREKCIFVTRWKTKKTGRQLGSGPCSRSLRSSGTRG